MIFNKQCGGRLHRSHPIEGVDKFVPRLDSRHV